MKYIESICDYLKIKDSSTRKKVRDMIDPLRSFAYVPSVGGYHSVGADEQPDDVNEHNFDFGREYVCTSRTVVLFELISTAKH